MSVDKPSGDAPKAERFTAYRSEDHNKAMRAAQQFGLGDGQCGIYAVEVVLASEHDALKAEMDARADRIEAFHHDEERRYMAERDEARAALADLKQQWQEDVVEPTVTALRADFAAARKAWMDQSAEMAAIQDKLEAVEREREGAYDALGKSGQTAAVFFASLSEARADYDALDEAKSVVNAENATLRAELAEATAYIHKTVEQLAEARAALEKAEIRLGYFNSVHDELSRTRAELAAANKDTRLPSLERKCATLRDENAELKQRWVATQEANAIRNIVKSPSNADLHWLWVRWFKHSEANNKEQIRSALAAIAERASAEEAT